VESGEKMKRNIIKQFEKARAFISKEQCRIELPLPSNIGKKAGKLVTIFLGEENTLFNLIEIYSTEIPEYIANPVKGTKELKINYCATGRCELQLKSGECTYLTAGEIAIDSGQAESSFYYPCGEYIGYEVIVYIESEETYLPKEALPAPLFLYKYFEGQPRPWIRAAGKFISVFYDTFKYYTEEKIGNELIFLKCMELLTYLTKLDFEQVNIRRTYYTASQTEIAKRVKELICSDLSIRYAARDLAERFGVSETSLKNYFRSVYGCGYAEFQQNARMEKAAELLKGTEQKIADIGLAVGFITQAKFGAAFKTYFGVTPLEYRRQHRLGEKSYMPNKK
jgi:araC-type DNA-binding domain-containing proteins